MGFLEDQMDEGMRLTMQLVDGLGIPYDEARIIVKWGMVPQRIPGTRAPVAETRPMTEETPSPPSDDTGPISAWIPVSDPRMLAMLGKMGEESAELSKAISRAIIMGLHTLDQENGLSNAENICRELQDVHACLHILEEMGHIQEPSKDDRFHKKLRGFRKWLSLIDNRLNLGKNYAP